MRCPRPLTLGRLTKDGCDKYRCRMKRTVAGKDELVLTGVELIEKLLLIAPPRIHVVRFHGVFAPNAKPRAQVVPQRPAPDVTDDEKVSPVAALTPGLGPR